VAHRMFSSRPGTQNSISCPLLTEYLIAISCVLSGILIVKRQNVNVLRRRLPLLFFNQQRE
jgi:hypothetical protein